MAIEVLYAAGAAGVTALAILARNERRLTKARRQIILDPVRGLFSDAKHSEDGAGLPAIEGNYGGRRLKLELIPDTMTIRRLPQLWLSVTALKPLEIAGGVAMLVRPSGADFYSLTAHMHTTFDPPRELPWETLVRGETAASGAVLAKLAGEAGRIMSDAKVKEIAATRRGLRIVYQLAEGKRGQHLLLRQSDFEGASLEPELLARLAADLDALAHALGATLQEMPL